MFPFFSKKQESVPVAQFVELLAEDRKQQTEIIYQSIEKVVTPICTSLKQQQENLSAEREKQAAEERSYLEKSLKEIQCANNAQLEVIQTNAKELVLTVAQSSEQCKQAMVEKLSTPQSISWQGYEEANSNSLIRVEEYKKTELLNQLAAEQKWRNNQKLKAAYALNMCMVSLSQIVDYNDINILQQEYDAILNNLNMENIIKDEALLEALKKILDTCHFYILHEKDKEMLKKKQAARLKGALGKALGGKGIIAIFGNPNPWAMVAGAAVLVGSAVVSYKSEKSKAQMENESEEWELAKTALEQLHNLRRTLFETAWRLAKTYEFPDKYRLTEKQIKIYNDAIADVDPLNRYERLDLLQDQFEAYPLFWYYLGRAALEAADLYRQLGDDEREYRDNPRPANMQIYHKYRQKAKEALDKFVDLHGPNQLLREDTIAASAYIDASDFYIDQPQKMKELIDKAVYPGASDFYQSNPDRMKECIDKAKEIAGLDLEILQSCAFRYVQMIPMFKREKQLELAEESRKSAIYCLRLLLNEGYNPDLNGRALSQLYIDKGDQKAMDEYAILKDCVARKIPFVYHYILPWNEEMYQKDLAQYFQNGSLYNTIGQYFEGRIRCIFAEFYQVAYESDIKDDNTALETYYADKENLERIDGMSLKISMEDLQTASNELKKIKQLVVFSDATKSCRDNYTTAINTFVKESKATERNYYTLGLKAHQIDFVQSEFDTRFGVVQEALYKLIDSIVTDVLERFNEQVLRCNSLWEEAKNRYNDDPTEYNRESWLKMQTSDDYILEIITFMTRECENMRQTIQTFTKGKFQYHQYTQKAKNKFLR